MGKNLFAPATRISNLVPELTTAVTHKSPHLAQKSSIKRLAHHLCQVTVDVVQGDESSESLASMLMRYPGELEVFETVRVVPSILEKHANGYDESYPENEDGLSILECHTHEPDYVSDSNEDCRDSSDDCGDDGGDECGDDGVNDCWYCHTYGHYMNEPRIENSTKSLRHHKSHLRNSKNSLGWRYSTLMRNISAIAYPDKLSIGSRILLIFLRL